VDSGDVFPASGDPASSGVGAPNASKARSAGLLRTGYAWKAGLVLAVIGAGLWTATHGVAGVAISDVGPVLRGVTPGRLGLLTVIWVAGLGIYSTVLNAALPGLGIRRSLLLNLSGSAVANLVRRWGHSNVAFVAFCVLTNVLDVVTKLVLPLVAVGALVIVGMDVPPVLWVVAVVCTSVLFLVLLAQVLLRKHRGGEEGTDRPWMARVRGPLRDPGGRIHTLLLHNWPRLLPGSIGYVAAQVALLFVSLRSVGLEASLATVLVAAAIERLGTIVPITPGGTGVAEIGTIAWLVTSGLDPVAVVAGVLLYRIFVIAMEIPVGGILLGSWAWLQWGSHRRRLAHEVVQGS